MPSIGSTHTCLCNRCQLRTPDQPVDSPALATDDAQTLFEANSSMTPVVPGRSTCRGLWSLRRCRHSFTAQSPDSKLAKMKFTFFATCAPIDDCHMSVQSICCESRNPTPPQRSLTRVPIWLFVIIEGQQCPCSFDDLPPEVVQLPVGKAPSSTQLGRCGERDFLLSLEPDPNRVIRRGSSSQQALPSSGENNRGIPLPLGATRQNETAQRGFHFSSNSWHFRRPCCRK